MREVPFSIVDTHGKRWAQMLDVDQQIKLFLPKLAETLGLPRELNYVLVPKGADLPLDARRTLADHRVPPGAELFLRPLRDQVLKMFLDQLYDQAKDYAKDKLIDLAKDKLKQILDLDPAYPDPLRLKEQLLVSAARPPVQPRPAQQFLSKPKPNTGWIVGGILGGGAVLLGGAVVAVVAIVLVVNALSNPSNNGGPVLGTGDVQITLRWDASADLDLHVYDPYQEEIWYNHRTSGSGGNLDVDANAGCNSMMDHPVENVFWPYGGAPGGSYSLYVVYFRDCGAYGPVSYEITIRQNDQVYDVISGTVYEVGEYQFVTSFYR
jgi:hypothetical protein